MRNKRLDILRCVAVVTVILHHSGESKFFTRAGWTGVDLFFVLSGFLISGLLFSEYRKRHAIDFKRFFIRRGLKIYPAFYVFLLITGIAGQLVFHTHPTLVQYLHEVFFIMNYKQGFWDHTWTLAVEEQFYIFLPVFLLLIVRFSAKRENPFRIIPWAAMAIASFCVISRALSVYIGTPNFHMAYNASHNRMDALFFGVLIGYVYHFRPTILEKLMRPTANRVAMAAVSVVLLSFAYFYGPDSKFFNTFGYSFIYLAFGGILLLSLYVHGVFSGKLGRLMELAGSAAAFVGMYSYSIYLWHGPVASWLPGLMRRTLGFSTGRLGRFAFYFIGSLVIGTVMSKLVEYPILRLRDRILPASNIVPVGAEVGIGHGRQRRMLDAAFIHNRRRVNSVKWIALLGRPDSPTDGVADYCAYLAAGLQARGIEMSLERVRWMEDGWFSGLRQLWRESAGWRHQWVILQYTALSWSRRGFPLGAVAVLEIMRRRGVRCAVVFHEPYRQSDASSRLIDRIRGACQDWTVRTLYRRAEKPIFADPLETVAWLPKTETKAVYIPIGANIPEPMPRSNSEESERKTIAIFCLSGLPNREREVNDISEAMRSAASNGTRLRVVFLGRGTAEAAEDIERAFQGSSVEVLNLGLRSAEEISRVLGESDAMLCVRGKLFPRRGSAIAGIACGLPIVAYAGASEGTPLGEAGIDLVPYGDRKALGDALARLLGNQHYWRQLHERSLCVQRKYFSWDRIASSFADALTEDRINS